MRRPFGSSLPRLRTAVPGPRSVALAARLTQVESRNLAPPLDQPPIVWAEARGANVRDVDGNVYVDLTAGFGVAATGHANRYVARAIARQARRLAHGLGDVQPTASKLELLERLAGLAPADLGVGILASGGAEAVEAALKTALLRTGRSGIIAFEDSYHGLSYGALAVTGRREFRAPFAVQLMPDVHFGPFPDGAVGSAAASLAAVGDRLGRGGIGAIIVEPILGRGGIIVPPDDFLPGLRQLASRHDAVLIFDEIYTGLGRTGRWFACERTATTPDILVIGKALAGGLPLSVALGTPAVMQAWPAWSGEALHTSTFLGNPIACAAAIAQLREIGRRGLVERTDLLGLLVGARLEQWRLRFGDDTCAPRGVGLLRGLHLRGARGADIARTAAAAMLRRGVIVLTEGPAGDVLAITPPLTIRRAQLHHALDLLETELATALRA
ncbi:MAG: aspartate aminotransferase family protein [Longimicrobiales bacterium]